MSDTAQQCTDNTNVMVSNAHFHLPPNFVSAEVYHGRGGMTNRQDRVLHGVRQVMDEHSKEGWQWVTVLGRTRHLVVDTQDILGYFHPLGILFDQEVYADIVSAGLGSSVTTDAASGKRKASRWYYAPNMQHGVQTNVLLCADNLIEYAEDPDSILKFILDPNWFIYDQLIIVFEPRPDGIFKPRDGLRRQWTTSEFMLYLKSRGLRAQSWTVNQSVGQATYWWLSITPPPFPKPYTMLGYNLMSMVDVVPDKDGKADAIVSP